MLLRPLRDDPDDAELARRVTEAAFRPLEAAGAGMPGADGGDWPPARVARFAERMRHLARHDPGGSWLALDDDGRPLGVASALRREGLWGLSLYAVAPGAQGTGVGRALLERAMAYGAGALRGLICSSQDLRAVRIYRLAGFKLHPAMRLAGEPQRDTLQPARWVRTGGAGDAGFADSVDWIARGAPHGPDHELLAATYPMLVGESGSGRGYCYLRDGSPHLLAATDAATARGLLSEALAQVPAGTSVAIDDVTAEQDWAVEVAVRAGLHVLPVSFVCVRGMRPPAPYIPSGAFL